MPKAKPHKGRKSQIETLVARVEEQFKPISVPRPVRHDATQGAQQRLDAALSSVNNVFLTLNLIRGVDREVQKKELRGRLSDTHIDMLRSAIVFSGAGLDASLKKLIKDTVRKIAVRNSRAKRKFLDFIDRHLAAADSPLNRKCLAEILVDGRGTQAALLEHYEIELTGDSLQAVNQVAAVCSALGIDARPIMERLKEGSLLDQMFKARNNIVHQLDLTDTGREVRRIEDVRKLAAEALSVTQEIINAVGSALGRK